VRLSWIDASTVSGELEDDFHRFGVTIAHDGHHVVGISGRAGRYPWTTCPGAVEPLRGLVGAALDTRLSALGQHAPAREHCTHLFDLAGLAIAHAARGAPTGRTYDVAIDDRNGKRTAPELWRDGESALRWQLAGRQLVGPPPFDGVSLRGGFISWAEATLDADTAEAASVLRRACDISLGRVMDLDGFETADMLGDAVRGTCHSFQPGTIERAVRVKGQTRDFSPDADALLRDP
jgi:hypothetical protein